MHPDYTPKDVARFWSKIAIAGPDDCWEWMAGRAAYRYGAINIGGKMIRAHRMAYELNFGMVPDGIYICHHCDNPLCCNPTHLFAGTQFDNVHDMISKRRDIKVRGITHGRHKLTEDQVQQIRTEYAQGNISQRKLARTFGIGRSEVWRIIHHEHWRHL